MAKGTSLRSHRKIGGTRAGAGRPPEPKSIKPLIPTPEAKATAAELARPHIALAIDALVATIKSPKTAPSARNSACRHILEAAKLDPGAVAALDTSQVSDIDLARWILSVLEGAAAPDAAEGDTTNVLQ